MYLEAESDIELNTSNEKDYKTRLSTKDKFISPALVEKVDESGKLLIKFLDEEAGKSFWIEATSNSLHPCGYWNYVSEKILKPANLSKHKNIRYFAVSKRLQKFYSSIFDWNEIFNKEESAQFSLPIAFSMFSDNQLDGMSLSYFPKLNEKRPGSHLQCDFPLNPRFVWSTVHKLNENDITSIYRETGIIKFHDDAKKKVKLASSALVLLPKNIDSNFIEYPNVNSVHNLCNLNVTCTHREEIKILVGEGYFMSINYPHLIQNDCLNLIDKNLRLNMRNLIDIMLTCLDLGNSPVN